MNRVFWFIFQRIGNKENVNSYHEKFLSMMSVLRSLQKDFVFKFVWMKSQVVFENIYKI